MRAGRLPLGARSSRPTRCSPSRTRGARGSSQAGALEQLGYQSESAVWRNIYLVGAKELRDGPPRQRPSRVASADVARALSIEQLWDALGARLDGPRAWDADIVIAWHFTDVRGALDGERAKRCADALIGRLDRARTRRSRSRARRSMRSCSKRATRRSCSRAAQIAVEETRAKLGELLGLLDEGDSAFAIVTP